MAEQWIDKLAVKLWELAQATLARRWHTTHLASPLRCRRLWLQPGDWTAQTWAACALAPGHDGPCKHIDPLGRLAPIPPDHVEVP